MGGGDIPGKADIIMLALGGVIMEPDAKSTFPTLEFANVTDVFASGKSECMINYGLGKNKIFKFKIML